MKCYICKNENLSLFLSLGHQPPSDAFLRPENLNKEEVTYPLDCYFCPSCALVQLGYAVDPELLFRDYVYNTATNNALKANFHELVETIIPKFKLTKDDLAVDVGANDGTLLLNYRPHEINILGIDPSSVAQTAKEKGIPMIVDFFNKDVAARAVKEYGKAKVITATNVFAHVVDLDSFMEGVTMLLDDKGVFITESAYIVDMVDNMLYDWVYHEHLRHYGVTALVALFERFGMEIIDVEHIKSHGGSIRVFAAKTGAHPIANSVSEFLKSEKTRGFTNLEIYKKFASRIVETKFKLLDIVLTLKKSGARIVGIGAPAKGNTLLNYCKLDSDMIDYLTEKSALKIGRFSPGMHIPVVDESRLFEEQPEAALILPWNIADELIPKLRKLGYKGKFILPNPVPMISDK